MYRFKQVIPQEVWCVDFDCSVEIPIIFAYDEEGGVLSPEVAILPGRVELDFRGVEVSGTATLILPSWLDRRRLRNVVDIIEEENANRRNRRRREAGLLSG